MLGGMWGVLRTQSREVWKDVWENIWSAIIADPISQSDRGTKGPDQILLSRHIWGQLHNHNPRIPGILGIPGVRAVSHFLFFNDGLPHRTELNCLEQDDKELLEGLKEQFLQPPSYEVKYKYT